MPTANAGNIKSFFELKKSGNKAKDFQKYKVEEWLDSAIDPIPLSDNR